MIVCCRRILHANETASAASMPNAKTSTRNKDISRFHRAAARRCAVARFFIKMFAPEAFRTVIGVATSLYTRVALRADKVLFGADETHD